MGVWEQFPYTNMQNANMDWVLQWVKQAMEEWASTKTEWSNMQKDFAELKAYVENYFKNLNVQEEINNKIDDLISSGVFDNIISKYMPPFLNTSRNCSSASCRPRNSSGRVTPRSRNLPVSSMHTAPQAASGQPLSFTVLYRVFRKSGCSRSSEST